ncbi:MAG: hypothetical protein H0X64_10320, partial [Gemmatimonadaceae bacterium]|nr:hypothetical protein [Gemmatimonadaceae bacterium]
MTGPREGPREGAGERRESERRGDERPASVRKAIRSELDQDPPRARVDDPSTPDRDESKPVIALEGVDLAFDKPILADISLEAYEGETVAIVGE